MGEKKSLFQSVVDMASDAVDSIDLSKVINQENLDTVKSMAIKTGDAVAEKAGEVKDVAMDLKADIDAKRNELDNKLKDAITEYNDAYTIMNDRGMQLYVARSRAVDALANIEDLVNSIANTPKEFQSDFEEIDNNRQAFTDTCAFAQRELEAARTTATQAGAGLVAGASVAFMAPTAAMWIATTFGTASTGVAISTLSGAAAESAALAWLGGGAVAAGGGGTAAGSALLALAGPVGWGIAGATLFASIALLVKKRGDIEKEKSEELESVRKNTISLKEVDGEIHQILTETGMLLEGLQDSYRSLLTGYGKNYLDFSPVEKKALGALVNNTKSLSALLGKNAGMGTAVTEATEDIGSAHVIETTEVEHE